MITQAPFRNAIGKAARAALAKVRAVDAELAAAREKAATAHQAAQKAADAEVAAGAVVSAFRRALDAVLADPESTAPQLSKAQAQLELAQAGFERAARGRFDSNMDEVSANLTVAHLEDRALAAKQAEQSADPEQYGLPPIE